MCEISTSPLCKSDFVVVNEAASNSSPAISIAGDMIAAGNTPPITNLAAIGEFDLLQNGKSCSAYNLSE
jgi:hypothetical protein